MSVSGIKYDLTVPANHKFDPARDRVLPLIHALCDPPGEWELAGEPDYVPTGKKKKATSAEKKKKADPEPESEKEEIWTNYDFCCACGRGGSVICCERCPMSYHLTCLVPPLKKKDIPEGEWICSRCEEMKRREADGVPIPETLKELIPLERKDAIEVAEKPKPQRAERGSKEEKPARGGRRRKYAFEPILQQIKKYRREEQKMIEAETKFFESVLLEPPSPKPKPKRKSKSKPKGCKWSRKKKHSKPKSDAPTKPTVPRKPRKIVLPDGEQPPLIVRFSSEKIRRKMIGCGERPLMVVMDEVVCAATIENEDGFSLTEDVICTSKNPTLFVEPERFIIKPRKPRKNAKEETPPPEEDSQPPAEPELSLSSDQEGEDDKPLLVDVNMRTPSPVVSKRQDGVLGCASRSQEEVDTVSEDDGECDPLSPTLTDEEGDEDDVSLADMLRQVRDDLSLQSFERFQVPEGVPRMYPRNFFPGDPRRDALHGGNEVAPSVVTEHILRRNDRGRAPLLCNQCSESCLSRPLLQCDYCPKYYHLDCVEPPFIEPPKRLWMCREHPIRDLEQLMLNDVRRSSRVKLWRREISLPLNENRIILDFVRKVQRPRAPNSSTDPAHVGFSKPIVKVNRALVEAYTTSDGEEEDEEPEFPVNDLAQAGPQGVDLAAPGASKPPRRMTEEEKTFVEALTRLQEQTLPQPPENTRATDEMDITEAGRSQAPKETSAAAQKDASEPQPGCSGESSKSVMKKAWYGTCDQYGDPGPSSRIRKDEAPFVPLTTYSDDDMDLDDAEDPGWAFKLEDQAPTPNHPEMINQPRQPEQIEEAEDVCLLRRGRKHVLQLLGENVLILQGIKGRSSDKELRETTFPSRKEFEGFLRGVIRSCGFSKGVMQFIPWNVLREARVDLGKRQRAVIRFDEPPETEPETDEESSERASEPKETAPSTSALVELEQIRPPPRESEAGDQVGEFIKTLSTEDKDAMLKNFLSWRFSSGTKLQVEPERTPPTTTELQQLVPEALRQGHPLALLTPLSKDFEMDGDPVPIYGHSVTVGCGSGAYLQLDRYGAKKCRFVDKYHATIIYNRGKSRFELINYSKYGTFVDNLLYCVGSLKELKGKMVTDGELCDCGPLPERRMKGFHGWRDLAAPLQQGSVVRFGCVSFLFCLAGNPPVPQLEAWPLTVSDDSDDESEEFEYVEVTSEDEDEEDDEVTIVEALRASDSQLLSSSSESDEDEVVEELMPEAPPRTPSPERNKRGKRTPLKSTTKKRKRKADKRRESTKQKNSPRKTRSMIQMRLTSAPK